MFRWIYRMPRWKRVLIWAAFSAVVLGAVYLLNVNSRWLLWPLR